MQEEIWKDIVGYEGHYQVSNFGRVKSFKREPPRILKTVNGTRNYVLIDLCKNNHTKTFSVHRFIPNPENKPQVNHIDGNPQNNHVSNLEWVTGKENMRHAVQTGLQKSGADLYNSRFTNDQIVYIRDNPDQLTVSELAEKFDVQTTQISRVQLGGTYKSVGGAIREHVARKSPVFLTDEQKKEIRRLYIKGDSQFGAVALAKIYGVHPDTIRVILETKRR